MSKGICVIKGTPMAMKSEKQVLQLHFTVQWWFLCSSGLEQFHTLPTEVTFKACHISIFRGVVQTYANCKQIVCIRFLITGQQPVHTTQPKTPIVLKCKTSYQPKLAKACIKSVCS